MASENTQALNIHVAETGQAPGRSNDDALLARYGGRISRDVLIYGIGMAAVFPFSLIQAAVLTRLMAPEAYGELAILLVFSSFITIFASLGTVHGTLMYVYKGSGDDGDDGDLGVVDDGMADEADGIALVGDKRLALGSGFWLLVIALLICGVPSIMLAPAIGEWLIGVDHAGDLVIWATLCAAAGAIFRLVQNVPRMERRPPLWVVLAIMRPTLVVGLVAWLVASGHGVTGALMGITIGTAVTCVVAVLSCVHSWGFGFSWRHAKNILISGRMYVVMSLSMWAMHSADALILSRYGTTAQVGVYRLASRLGSIPSYFVSAFLFSMSPLERSSLFHATYDRHGGMYALRRELYTYYVVTALSIALAMAVAADVMVLIAAPSYADAASQLPLIALSFVIYGLFTVTFRFSGMAHRRAMRLLLTTFAMLIFFGASTIFVPAFGAYGIPLAQILGMGTGVVIMILLARLQPPDESLRPDFPRLLTGCLCVAACWAIGTRLATLMGPGLHVLLGVGSLALYPLLLVATRTIPRSQIKTLWSAMRWMVRSERYGGRDLVERVPTLPARRRAVVEAVLRDGRSIDEVAEDERIAPEEAAARLTRGLRQIAGLGASKPEADGEVGTYLALDASTAARDAMATRLRDEAGVDALELHELESAYAQLRKQPRAWRRVVRSSSA